MTPTRRLAGLLIAHRTTLGTASAQTSAPKPILDGFTADPAIRVFGDTYYVYPTSDKPNWMTTDFSVWSSKNLIDWKKERMILDVTKELKWANIKAWAPDAIERYGTYFFYFCADGKIGVATAKSPAGPFVDALGKPLLDRKADIHLARRSGAEGWLIKPLDALRLHKAAAAVLDGGEYREGIPAEPRVESRLDSPAPDDATETAGAGDTAAGEPASTR